MVAVAAAAVVVVVVVVAVIVVVCYSCCCRGGFVWFRRVCFLMRIVLSFDPSFLFSSTVLLLFFF